MGNCYSCKNRQVMGMMIGCTEKCKIIINPQDPQDCYKPDMLDKLREQCDLPDAFWEAFGGKK